MNQSNLNSLYSHYNDRLFGSRLPDVAVKWSNRLRRAAGVADYEKEEIRLSQSTIGNNFKWIANTLVHEMIHIEIGLVEGDYRGGYGPRFREEMHRINKLNQGLVITIRHNYEWRKNTPRSHTAGYVTKCPRCKTISETVRRQPRKYACRRCCEKFNSGNFSPKYLLEWYPLIEDGYDRCARPLYRISQKNYVPDSWRNK